MEQFYLWLHRQNFFEQFYGAHSVLIQNADPIARKNFLILFENPVSKRKRYLPDRQKLFGAKVCQRLIKRYVIF